jgi:flagellar biosynthesis protein
MNNDDIGVALEYSGDLPRILAVARGKLFEQLIRIAREHRITVYHDADLAFALSIMPVGSEIPEFLFKAVSEVLAFCYKVNEKFKAKVDHMGIL